MKLDKCWRQVGGDMHPGYHGATLARLDGEAIEFLEIQPVRDYVGDTEAIDVGCPFWSVSSYHDPIDLDPSKPDVAFAMRSSDVKADASPLEIALACHVHGIRRDEESAGWARDVFPEKAYYWSKKRPVSGAFFADADAEFRRLLKESSK